MKKILMSVMAIAMVATLSAGATQAYFSSQAKVEGNTFETGTLTIAAQQFDGIPLVFSTENQKPGPQSCKEGAFNVKNTGTLDVTTLTLSAPRNDADENLYNALTIEVKGEKTQNIWHNGWWLFPGWMEHRTEHYNIYSTGALSGLNASMLDGVINGVDFTKLVSGDTEKLEYKICLPDTDVPQNELQGKTAQFDFVVDAR